MRFSVVGPGRAGQAFTKALSSVGWELVQTYGRDDDISAAAEDVALVLLCVPDGAIEGVAGSVRAGEAAIVHTAGSRQLDVLGDHERVGSIHPLMTLPDRDRGAARLLDSCRFAVAGDPITLAIAAALGGHSFGVDEHKRMLYHAAAAVASNHMVALAAQVERLARLAGVPADAYWPLMVASLDNVVATDPTIALTGPAARGDWDTIRGHLAAIADAYEDEPGTDVDRKLYLALAEEAARLADSQLPQDLQ